MTISNQPAHIVRAMADRAASIAASLGYDAPRYNRLALRLRDELSRRAAELAGMVSRVDGD